MKVILLAGGFGSRLSEYTEVLPKPMVSIGGKPLLESIIEDFTRQGLRRFIISVNYKAQMITNYFGDGSQWKAEESLWQLLGHSNSSTNKAGKRRQ